MRRLLFALCLLGCCCAAQSFALVQTTAGTGGTTAFASNVGAGHLLVMCGSTMSATATVTGVSDTLSNVWADSGFSSPNNSGLNETADCWYALASASSGSDTLTITRGSGAGGTNHLMEFSYSGSISFDSGASGEADTDNPSISITAAKSGGLIVSMAVSSATLLAGSSYTSALANANNWFEHTEYNLSSASGGQAANWSGTGVSWTETASAFKSVSAAAAMVPRHGASICCQQ